MNSFFEEIRKFGSLTQWANEWGRKVGIEVKKRKMAKIRMMIKEKFGRLVMMTS